MARHGERPVAVLSVIEDMRVRLVASSDLYVLRSDRDARRQLAAAQAAYSGLSPQVRAGDRVLDREISAAFKLVDSAMAAGADLAAVRDRIRALSGQLLDGAWDELVPFEARADPGVRAEVLLRTTRALESEYREGVRAGSGGAGRLRYEHAYGLLARSQILARGISGSLGSQREAVSGTLTTLREQAFPLGVARAPFLLPAPTAAREIAKMQQAVRKRFELR